MKKVFLILIMLMVAVGGLAGTCLGNIRTWELHTGDTSGGATSYLTGNTTAACQSDCAYSGASPFFIVGYGGVSTFEIDTSKNAYAVNLTGVTESQVQQQAGGDWSGTSIAVVAWTANEDTAAAWNAAEAHVVYWGKPISSGSTPWAYPLRLPPAKYMRMGIVSSGVTAFDGVQATLVQLPGSANWVDPQTDTIANATTITVTDAAVYWLYATLGDPPAGTKRIWITFEGAVREYVDGHTSPTTSKGVYIDETLPYLKSREMYYKIGLISESGNVECTIHFLNN